MPLFSFESTLELCHQLQLTDAQSSSVAKYSCFRYNHLFCLPQCFYKAQLPLVSNWAAASVNFELFNILCHFERSNCFDWLAGVKMHISMDIIISLGAIVQLIDFCQYNWLKYAFILCTVKLIIHTYYINSKSSFLTISGDNSIQMPLLHKAHLLISLTVMIFINGEGSWFHGFHAIDCFDQNHCCTSLLFWRHWACWSLTRSCYPNKIQFCQIMCANCDDGDCWSAQRL